MSPVLVVGATGQLGTAVVRRLAAAGRNVRAFVRPGSDHRHLHMEGVELAFGDLRDEASIAAACHGGGAVIATANTVIPRGRYSFDANERDGYDHLIAAARRTSVSRFVFMSVPVSPMDDQVPTFRLKRRIERRLQESGVPFTIFRGSLFMDDWLALIGSSIPLRGAEAATLRRPYWFSQFYMSAVGHMIENRGVAVIPGSGTTRHAFVALDDVAEFLARAVDLSQARDAVFELGGPQIISWDEAAAIFSKVLGRPVRVVHLPTVVFRVQQQMLAPFSPAASNLMGMNWIAGSADTAYRMDAVTSMFGVTLTSVERFLRDRLNLASD